MKKSLTIIICILIALLIAERWHILGYTKMLFNSEFEYFDNNNVSKLTIEQNDTLITREYFEDGSLRLFYITINGRKNGNYIEYNSNGSTKIERSYLMDSIKSEAYFYYTEKDSLERIEVFSYD